VRKNDRHLGVGETARPLPARGCLD
jgi:hypothetical protein